MRAIDVWILIRGNSNNSVSVHEQGEDGGVWQLCISFWLMWGGVGSEGVVEERVMVICFIIVHEISKAKHGQLYAYSLFLCVCVCVCVSSPPPPPLCVAAIPGTRT